MRELVVVNNRQWCAKAKDYATGQARYLPAVVVMPGSRKFCRKIFTTATEAERYAQRVQQRYAVKYAFYRKILWTKMQYSKLPWYKKLEWQIKKVYYELRGIDTVLSLLDYRM